MSLKILSQYEEDGIQIVEYTKDGVSVSHTVKTPIPQEIAEEPQTTIEEQILAENQYQTALLEMQMLGGM